MDTEKIEDKPTSEANSLGLNQLLSVDQSAILGVIESLRHISKYDIDLPRIIVCGDQSCGKSSVLEAISRLNFPRDERTCTTFATELTLDHQGAPGSISVNILWENLKDGAEEFHPKDLSVENLGSTINEAKRIMERRSGENGRRFFKNILQIKASNPNWPPLTLVDLPGLVHSGMEDRDLEIVREIICTHMSQPQTIILAVVDASKDPETQAILKMAQKCDPGGRRTMGIITKPDRVPGPKVKSQWIEMATKKSGPYQFELGWHVVKNRDVEEANSSFDERDQKEVEFFRKSDWMDQLNADQLGIDTLRVRVSEILERHTRAALPGIMKELNSKLKHCQQSLKSLGPSRNTLSEQQMYLSGIGSTFQEITKDAVTAQYEGYKGYSEEFFRDPKRRYYARIKSQNKTFVDWMYGWGHTYEELELPAKRDSEAPVINDNTVRLDTPESISRAEFISKVQRIQAESGGLEVDGTYNPQHLTTLFKNQSCRWREIAKAHVENVWKATYQFLLEVVKFSTGPDNEHTAHALIQHIINPEMEEKKETLTRKLDEILRPFEKFPVMTYDPEFVREKDVLYTKLRVETQSGLAGHIAAAHAESAAMAKFIKEPLANYQWPKNEFPSDSSQILDLMKLYYNNSLRTFINNIVSLGIYNSLVYDLPDIFSDRKVQYIARDNKALLQALASEPSRALAHRKSLEVKQKDLQKALDECKKQFGDINLYIIDSEGPLNSKVVQPSFNVLPPESSSIAPHYEGGYLNGVLPSGKPRSRASSTQSAQSASSESTALTIPSPEGSVSGKELGGRRSKRPSKESLSDKKVARQNSSAEEEL